MAHYLLITRGLAVYFLLVAVVVVGSGGGGGPIITVSTTASHFAWEMLTFSQRCGG
jgi:hypothetical protein